MNVKSEQLCDKLENVKAEIKRMKMNMLVYQRWDSLRRMTFGVVDYTVINIGKSKDGPRHAVVATIILDKDVGKRSKDVCDWMIWVLLGQIGTKPKNTICSSCI